MIVYLMRHGLAIERDDPACPVDEERSLTTKGRKRARAVAERLRVLGVAPNVVLSSPLVRAIETAEIVVSALEMPDDVIHRTDALRPEAGAADVFEALRKIDAGDALCVGHAPNLDDIIAFVLSSRRRVTALKKAGVAALEIDSISSPRGRLLWLASPGLLRAEE